MKCSICPCFVPYSSFHITGLFFFFLLVLIFPSSFLSTKKIKIKLYRSDNYYISTLFWPIFKNMVRLMCTYNFTSFPLNVVFSHIIKNFINILQRLIYYFILCTPYTWTISSLVLDILIISSILLYK